MSIVGVLFFTCTTFMFDCLNFITKKDYYRVPMYDFESLVIAGFIAELILTILQIATCTDM